MKVSVFGLGYVGSVSAASFAADGHTVVGVDVNADKVASLNEGRSPIVEKGLDELIRASAANGSLRATTSTAEAVHATDLSLLCVGTPSRKNGSLDLSYLERVCEQIGEALEAQGRLPRRRGPQHRAAGHDARRGHSDARAGARARSTATGFGVTVNPEFLREGTAIHDFRTSAADAGRPQLRSPTRRRPRRSTPGSTRRSSTRASAPPR